MAFTRVASTDDVPQGEVRVFEAGGLSLCVANVDGKFYAIDNLCTHDGGPLGEGSLWDNQVECPRHGARFDLETGRAVTLPAVRGVRTYEVRVEDDGVEVDVE